MINREFIKAENLAYDQLVKKGYTPQGRRKDFKQVIIYKYETENRMKEFPKVYKFNNWQEANKSLN